MPWVRFDDQFPIHRKIEPLSDGAFRLAVCAVFWSSRQLTDGCIPKSDLAFAAPRTMKRPEKFVKELVDAGLWVATGDGWNIHDFLDYQPSKDQVTADRAKTAERQRRWRERHNKAVTNDVSNGVTNTVTNRVSNAAPARPDPARPREVLKPLCTADAEHDVDALVPSPSKQPEPGSDHDPDWTKFWATYPRKASKDGARKSWRSAIKRAKAADIIAGAERYRADPARTDKFTKLATTWLNQGCWDDEPLPARSPNGHRPYQNPTSPNAYGELT